MMKLRCQMAFAGLVCVAGFWNVGEAAGQSLGTPSTNPGTTSGMPITGIPIMPLPLTTPMFASPLPNSASPGTDAGGNPVQGNIFANPYAAPLIYGSMMQGPFGSSLSSSATASTSTSMSSSTAASASASAANSRANMGLGVGQLGLLMLATQNPNGIGSGQLSGAQSARTQSGARTAAKVTSRARTWSQPAGLAAHYFSRTTSRPQIPQNFYNRPTRYFP